MCHVDHEKGIASWRFHHSATSGRQSGSIRRATTTMAGTSAPASLRFAVRDLAGPSAQQLFEWPETSSVMVRQRPLEGVGRLAISGGHYAHGFPRSESVRRRFVALDEEAFDERGDILAESSARRCVVAVLVVPQSVSHCRWLRVQRYRHDRAEGPENLVAEGAAVAETFCLIAMSPADGAHVGALQRYGDAVGRERIAESGERLVHLSAGRPVP